MSPIVTVLLIIAIVILSVIAVFSVMSVTAFAISEDGGEIDLWEEPAKKIEQSVEKKIVTEPEKKEETPAVGVEKAKERVAAIGAELTEEESPLVSFSFESVLALISDAFHAAVEFVTNFLTILFNGKFGG